MKAHWERFGPPVYLSVAGYLGLIKPEAKGVERRKLKSAKTARDFMADFAAAGGTMQ